MNKVRTIGLIMLLIGIIIQYTFENDGIDFLTGLLTGSGIVLLITGKLKSKKKIESQSDS
jgi:hypothetical protein